ncbi:MAG: hypothetical protein JXL67_01210, partial [Calditrichaeota bacterium]|nr:hypothetical protein [Calditrichota bacterium]
YVPAIEYQEKPPRKWRRKVLDFLESKLDKIFLKKTMATSFNSVSDLVIRHYFKDLDDYYSATIPAESGEAVPAKEVIRKRLYDVLYKFRNKKILLLAHSMGTIIAYEVLMENQQKIFIDTFVTFGSPLGQPIILRKFYEELQKNLDLDHKPVVPDNIQSNWFNLSDLEDHIALNYNLNDDFEESSRKISVSDKVVYNNYVYERKRNPHKSYGYLRTPEMAEIIYQFLSRDRSRFTLWMESRWNEVMDKLWARGKR